MEKEYLYENDYAYTEIIDWPNIARLIGSMHFAPIGYRPFSGICKTEDEDSKNICTYSYCFDYGRETEHYSGKSKRLTLSSSDGRKLVVEYASAVDCDDIILTYKLGDKELEYKMSLSGKLKFSLGDIPLRYINMKITYDSYEFTNSLLPYYYSLKIFEKFDEAKKIKEVHKNIIDQLFNNVFSTEELKMFHDNVDPIIYQERCDDMAATNKILTSRW